MSLCSIAVCVAFTVAGSFAVVVVDAVATASVFVTDDTASISAATAVVSVIVGPGATVSSLY